MNSTEKTNEQFLMIHDSLLKLLILFIVRYIIRFRIFAKHINSVGVIHTSGVFFVVEAAKMILLVIARDIRRQFLLAVVPRHSPIFASAIVCGGVFAVAYPSKVVEAVVRSVSVNIPHLLFIVRILNEFINNEAMCEALMHPTFL